MSKTVSDICRGAITLVRRGWTADRVTGGTTRDGDPVVVWDPTCERWSLDGAIRASCKTSEDDKKLIKLYGRLKVQNKNQHPMDLGANQEESIAILTRAIEDGVKP